MFALSECVRKFIFILTIQYYVLHFILFSFLYCFIFDFTFRLSLRSVVGQRCKGATVNETGSIPMRGYESLVFFIFLFALVSRQIAVLSTATQHAVPQEFSRKLRTECLNIRFPLPIMLCEKQKQFFIFKHFLKCYSTLEKKNTYLENV